MSSRVPIFGDFSKSCFLIISNKTKIYANEVDETTTTEGGKKKKKTTRRPWKSKWNNRKKNTKKKEFKT